MPEYDYIVVGAGTAGCVLAARLSADSSARVLLAEAGTAERTRAMTVPNAWPENLGTAADWADLTTDQADAGAALYPRGRTLGGSSSINAMVHVRGHRGVYDAWAAAGADGWDFASLLPCFLRSETAEGRDPALRGMDGPVRVAPAAPGRRHPAAVAFTEALGGLGVAATDDLSGARQEGAGWTDLAIADGERVSAADAYLRPVLDRPNLTVATGGLVTRLRVQRGRCRGISYRTSGGTVEADAAAEVIVCAGAIGSPQLLMLSGLGDPDGLRRLGIDPVADLPGVGANLQDHALIVASFVPPSPLPASQYNHGEACAALRSDLAGAYPDTHLLPILVPLPPTGHEPPPADAFCVVASVVAPDSRGSVRLASADPGQPPLIDPGFLRDSRDTDRLEAGLRLVREAAAGPAFGGLIKTEVYPGPGVRSAADLRGYIRRGVGSYYHPAGSCRMGSDENAVVDPELRVRGVSGLRIADASVMPLIPNAYPNATVLAIAERAVSLLTSGAL